MHQMLLLSKSVFFLAVFLGVCCETAESIKCYVCSSRDNETMCRDPEWYNLPLMKCDQMTLENTRHLAKRIDSSYNKIFDVDTSDMSKRLDLNCLKVVTRVGKKYYTFRGCQLAEQSSLDICVKMNKVNTDFLKKVHCSRCGTDGCNLAPNPPKLCVPTLTLYLILVTFYLI